MPKSKSSRAARREAPVLARNNKDSEDEDDDDDEESTEKEEDSLLSENRSRSDLNISARPDLSPCGSNKTSPDIHKRLPKYHTPSPPRKDDTNVKDTSKSPKPMYPSLDEFKTETKRSENPRRKKSVHDDLCCTVYQKIICQLLIIVLTLLLLTAASYFCLKFFTSPTPSGIAADSTFPFFETYVGLVSNMENTFSNQNKKLWRTIKSSVMHVLKEKESRYPVVILIASPERLANVSMCIAKKVASAFEVAKGLIPLQSSASIREFHHLDPSSQKQKLDDDMELAFSKGQKSFIVDNLQLLHPEAALLLHGYCDNDNAPYKDVMIILLMYINKEDVSDFTSSAVESYLEQLWTKDMDANKVKALLSRVANNVVTVEEEDERTVIKECMW